MPDRIVLYRKNGGQVIALNSNLSSYAFIDTTYLATIVNPPCPSDHDLPSGADFSKPTIWDGSTLRPATGPEQATFVTAAATDATLQHRSLALAHLQSDPGMRTILQAIIGLMVQQLNMVRTQPTTTFAALTPAAVVQAIADAITAGSFD